MQVCPLRMSLGMVLFLAVVASSCLTKLGRSSGCAYVLRLGGSLNGGLLTSNHFAPDMKGYWACPSTGRPSGLVLWLKNLEISVY